MSRSDISSDGEMLPGGNGHGAMVPVGNHSVSVSTMGWPFGLAMRPDALTAKPGFVDLLHALRRRWLLGLGLGLAVAAGITALVWIFLPVRFEASSALLVSEEDANFLRSSGAKGDFKDYKKTQVQLVKSPLVIQAALRESDVSGVAMLRAHTDPVDWLKDNLLVDFPGDANMLQITLRGAEPADLAKVVNAVTNAYLDKVVNEEKAVKLEKRDNLDKLVQEYDRDLTDLRRRRRTLESSGSVFGTPLWMAEQSMRTRDLDTQRAQRDATLHQISDVEMKLLMAKLLTKSWEEKSQDFPELLLRKEMRQNPEMNQLKITIEKLGQQLSAEALRLKNPERNPTVLGLKAQLEKLQDEYEDMKEMLKEELIEQYKSGGSLDGTAMSIPVLEAQLKALFARFQALTKDVEKRSNDLRAAQKDNADWENVAGQIKDKENTYKDLVLQQQAVSAEIKSFRPQVRLVQSAEVPRTNNAWQKYLGMAFCGLFGFGVVLLCVALAEFQSRKLSTVTQVNEKLGLRVLGQLPTLSGRAWRKMQAGADGSGSLQALLMESIDSVRAALVHSATVNAPRVVLVTSAEPHEGKTTVATQLAASLARSGQKTLLVDADLRNPAVHLVFSLPSEPGVSEVLRGTVPWDTAAVPAHTPRLWVLPAGRSDLRSLQALAGEAIERLISAWRAEFDFVVIDAGSVLRVADPMLIGQHVDVAVMSSQRDISRLPQVYEAVERLSAVGVTVLGVVVNGASDRAVGHRMLPETSDAEPTAAA